MLTVAPELHHFLVVRSLATGRTISELTDTAVALLLKAEQQQELRELRAKGIEARAAW